MVTGRRHRPELTKLATTMRGSGRHERAQPDVGASQPLDRSPMRPRLLPRPLHNRARRPARQATAGRRRAITTSRSGRDRGHLLPAATSKIHPPDGILQPRPGVLLLGEDDGVVGVSAGVGCPGDVAGARGVLESGARLAGVSAGSFGAPIALEARGVEVVCAAARVGRLDNRRAAE
jgi:hypothetical protein